MENLSQVRKIISSKIEVEFVFLFETVIIDKNQEESIKYMKYQMNKKFIYYPLKIMIKFKSIFT